MTEIRSKIDKTQLYSIDEGLALLKELATTKFDESVDAAINLGVDPRKSDQNVRGSSVLPNRPRSSARWFTSDWNCSTAVPSPRGRGFG